MNGGEVEALPCSIMPTKKFRTYDGNSKIILWRTPQYWFRQQSRLNSSRQNSDEKQDVCLASKCLSQRYSLGI